ncbi:MAG: Cyclic dehypoxanthine futalosine synthase [Phycisphaerae bacterium]|nr:Cyclic dehypoxanthine futalosine synthase [Phycisphaerae bacterium]
MTPPAARERWRRSNRIAWSAHLAHSTRLSDADALALYHDLSIHELGRRAFARLSELHPEPYRTYVVDRNINYANVCTARCIFCNFKADPGDADAYILSFEQIGRKIEELIEIGGTQILMQGGLVPDQNDPHGHGLPFEWYLDLLRFIRGNYPSIHIHAFSPPEIWAFHQVYHMPLRDVLLRLRDAGLATIPGGGGEILVDRVRRKIGQGKTLTHEWLAVMRAAHQLGMKTSCTMMFGHIETVEERIEHMRLLRDLQDETGGFTAFIHWPFQPEGTPLGRWKRLPVDEREIVRKSESGNGSADARPSHVPTLPPSHFARPAPDGEHLLLADAHEYLVMLAIARLYFDNIPNIQSSWVTMGPKVGQLALFYGANDMGSVMMEENVVSQAGATYRLSEDEIRRLITDAGWQPQQRDQYYRPVDTSAQRRGSGGAPPGASREAQPVVPLTVSGTSPAAR